MDLHLGGVHRQGLGEVSPEVPVHLVVQQLVTGGVVVPFLPHQLQEVAAAPRLGSGGQRQTELFCIGPRQRFLKGPTFTLALLPEKLFRVSLVQKIVSFCCCAAGFEEEAGRCRRWRCVIHDLHELQIHDDL